MFEKLFLFNLVLAFCCVDTVQSKSFPHSSHRFLQSDDENWFCSLRGWNFGEWSDDGHIFYPYYRSSITSGNISSGDSKSSNDISKSSNYEQNNLLLRKEPDSYIIYNTESLRSCLRNKVLVLLGPSYMRDIWHSVVDLLHGVLTEDLLAYSQRNPPEKNVTVLGPGFENINFVHIHGWSDQKSWNHDVLRAIKMASNNTMLADNLIWDIRDESKETEESVNSAYFLRLAEFLYLCKKYNVHLVWMSQMVGTHIETSTGIPVRFLHQQGDHRIIKYLNLTIQYLNIYDFPFLDVFHMTRNCVSDKNVIKRWGSNNQGCVSSGHSHWYTARMKFQVFANYFCRDCIK